MSNTNKYLAFVKTVEYGSFTKAAEVLNYSQSGISRMIKDIEEEWHLSLLERNNVGVELTSEGLQMLPLIRELCKAEEKIQEQIQDIKGVQTGLIRIGTVSSVATYWLPNIISRFNQDYPEIDYEILSGDYREIEEWLTSGRVDCGFLRSPTKAKLEVEHLGEDRLMAVLPKDHPLAQLPTFPVRAFEDQPFMLIENDGVDDISYYLESWGVDPEIKFSTWDDYAVLAMIEQGLGIGVLSELILSRLSFSVVVKELEFPAFRNLAFAVENSESSSNAVKKFREYLKFRYETYNS